MTSGRTAICAISTFATILAYTPVLGDDINCQTDYGNVNLDDNVMVAAPCTLNGTTVEGNIKLFAGGSLITIGAVIDGNIKAESADFVDLQDTEVKGSIRLDEMVGDISYIRDSTISGSVVLNNTRSRLELLRNYIGSNLQAFENSGGVFIFDNVIDGNLQCKNNHPEPEGGNNMVSGKDQDQCRGLQAAPFEINTGTGGGGSTGPLLIVFLLVVGLVQSRRRTTPYLPGLHSPAGLPRTFG